MPGSQWHAELAWVEGRLATDVLLEIEGERFARVTSATVRPADAVRLEGITIPGLANTHSHAFQRALRGRTHGSAADFWAWRDLMYRVAERLDPDLYYDLARATYGEMVLAGITAVGEFHYLHHRSEGRRYADPNAMGLALISAAEEAGVRITLIDTCYLWSGFRQSEPDSTQRRFSDGSAEAWAERVSALGASDRVRVGAAIHSVRAVDAEAMSAVAGWAADNGAPLHLHLSEQPAENEACLEETGMTPTELIASAGALGPRTTAVHGTHLTRADIALLGDSGTCVCLCPTTERDLGDGVGPARALADAGSPLAVGSDMHATIDLLEEARALELDERMISGRRGIHTPEALLDAATTSGMRALGWDAGGLRPGGLADFTTVSLSSPRTAGATSDNALQHLVFAASAADVTTVVVGGETIVAEGEHRRIGDVGAALKHALAALEVDTRNDTTR